MIYKDKSIIVGGLCDPLNVSQSKFKESKKMEDYFGSRSMTMIFEICYFERIYNKLV